MTGAALDHCTGWFEGWWGTACCAPHDADYAAQVGRWLADSRLLQCVAATLPEWAAAHPVLAAAASAASAGMGALMWVGVRVFGGRFYRRAGKMPDRPGAGP